jgi:hypothetical protein
MVMLVLGLHLCRLVVVMLIHLAPYIRVVK